jgi:hypothetical protein
MHQYLAAMETRREPADGPYNFPNRGTRNLENQLRCFRSVMSAEPCSVTTGVPLVSSSHNKLWICSSILYIYANQTVLQAGVGEYLIAL